MRIDHIFLSLSEWRFTFRHISSKILRSSSVFKKVSFKMLNFFTLSTLFLTLIVYSKPIVMLDFSRSSFRLWIPIWWVLHFVCDRSSSFLLSLAIIKIIAYLSFAFHWKFFFFCKSFVISTTHLKLRTHLAMNFIFDCVRFCSFVFQVFQLWLYLILVFSWTWMNFWLQAGSQFVLLKLGYLSCGICIFRINKNEFFIKDLIFIHVIQNYLTAHFSILLSQKPF